MTATKILWGQIIAVFAIVLATMWGATEWTAWRLGFQPQPGPPWFEVANVPVYLPVAFFWWWYHYDAYAPQIFIEGAAIAASGGFASIGIAIGMSVWRAREAKTINAIYRAARVIVALEGLVNILSPGAPAFSRGSWTRARRPPSAPKMIGAAPLRAIMPMPLAIIPKLCCRINRVGRAES